jgi:hypothetical protein
VIYRTDAQEEDNIEYFTLSGISFREYTHEYGHTIDIPDILSGREDITALNKLRDAYIHRGEYGLLSEDDEMNDREFDHQIEVMRAELFEKEYDVFIEFIRTVATGIGDLFKEERIGKLMNVSRRKVRKYTEILMRHGMIE